MAENNDILNDALSDAHKSGERLTDERLMAYLSGALSAKEQHEVEQWLAQEGMESDALEGLKSIEPIEAEQAVQRLNKKLLENVSPSRRRRRPQSHNQFTLFAIVCVLLLAALGYIVLKVIVITKRF